MQVVRLTSAPSASGIREVSHESPAVPRMVTILVCRRTQQYRQNLPKHLFAHSMSGPQPSMTRTLTDLGHSTTPSLKKGSQSLVLSLADQRLTLEYDENLDQFMDGMYQLTCSYEQHTDCHSDLLEKYKITRKPWKRSMQLKLPKKDSGYSYPVDIRIDSVSPWMVFKRVLGIVEFVRVYTGPLVEH
jgi:hypothetical protein